jgi:NADH-quinone oxidoreductase subunit N
MLFTVGTCFITLGLFFKAAVVPFHIWAPDVYDGAPTPVAAFMAVGTKVGAFIAFARIFLEALYQFNPAWNEALGIFVYPTLIFANFLALRQKQIKRFFAYSGISHAGFLLIPLASSTSESMSALLFYLVTYALSTLGCFAVFAFIDRDSNGVSLDDLKGLFMKNPFASLILSFCLLTLAAIPPTSGFFAKFYVFKTAFDAGFFGLVFVGLITSVVSAIYYVRMIGYVFTPTYEDKEKVRFTYQAAVVGLFCFVGLLLLSFYPNILVSYLIELN